MSSFSVTVHQERVRECPFSSTLRCFEKIMLKISTTDLVKISFPLFSCIVISTRYIKTGQLLYLLVGNAHQRLLLSNKSAYFSYHLLCLYFHYMLISTQENQADAANAVTLIITIAGSIFYLTTKNSIIILGYFSYRDKVE